ncbi:MAG: signal recognition particle-docking protein FtsY, partial [Candidatus Obscuribacterales bacterium]|nr:signal recognition particle-docking protein FtsY [Candidatus Obscuribacterales bacterium]
MSEDEERKGWWGSTVGKLKTALSKTKSAIRESVQGDAPEGENFEEISSTIASSQDSQMPTPKNGTSVLQQSQPNEAIGEVGDDREQTCVEADRDGAPSQPDETGIGFARAQAKDQAIVDLEVSTLQAFPRSQKTESQVTDLPEIETKTVDINVAAVELVAASREVSRQLKIDEDYLESLEEKLIKADIGLENAESVVKNLSTRVKNETWNTDKVMTFLKDEFLTILRKAPTSTLSHKPGAVNVYLIVGVNGTGKTTSIGKLCWRFKKEGKRVLMAAGDTFRAAAESQLEIWSQRAGVDIIRLEDGSDPGAVVFKALARAKEEGYDCLVIDTAGRLHNKTDLMNELKKIRAVIDKHGSGCPLESLLVLDASTGQNGLQQARVFTEVCSLTGVILTKLDGTAKGGIVFS